MKSIKELRTLSCVLCLGQALLPLLFAQSQAKAAGSDPIVTISTGQLRGSLTSNGGAVFKNIPFAQPPVGQLRWREPLPAKAWTGVRDATAFGPMCNQNDNKSMPHSEDCLQLNVWTTKWPQTSPVPVMVWIHGGGNTAGSGVEALFNGEVLARHGVVVVNVNYRLGIFGFFAHPGLTKESPHHAAGNYGLADQIVALHWVRDNIAKFGGDPKNVTIFGESAGAGDVNALIASPLTKGLFVRVIAQSGPAGAGLALADAERRGVDFAASLGFTGDDALAKLRGLPETELIVKSARAGLGITVDGWVLQEPATKIYAQGREQKVALLIGNNSQEMQPRGAPGDIRQMISQRYGPLADRALAAYGVNGANDPQPDPENGSVMLQFTTDNSFRCGTVQELIWHTAAKNTGYEYQFSRTVHGQEALGAPHASEIPFIFGTLPVWQNMRKYNDSDQQYAPQMQEYWTNFAKTGDPNGGKLVKWPKFDAAARAYIDFTDSGPVAKEGLRRQACDVFMENQKRQGL
ncbi:MAG: carboxylesterase family protein [Acidobacteriia bacterium]|nr:carboxylesterase family protein [Terriglobia bacterium]